MARNIFKEIERSVMNEQMEETTRQKLLGNLLRMKDQKINLMVTGATGVGKSSTINSLFGEEVAKVGTSVNPETMGIDKYKLDNLVIWDTPGLGSVGRIIGTVGGAIVGVGANIISGVVDFFGGIF